MNIVAHSLIIFNVALLPAKMMTFYFAQAKTAVLLLV